MGRSLQNRKTTILEKTDAIDIKAETMGMNSKNREGTRELENRLKFVIREEKFKWFQRSKEKELLREIVALNIFMPTT